MDLRSVVGGQLRQRVGPSIALAIPTFVLGIFAVIVFSLLLVFFRHTYLEFWGVALAVFLMSVSGLFYIIAGQYFFSKLLKLVPISGFAGGWDMFVFLALPIAIGIFSRLGGEALFYRTMFLEEIGKDYVRTARSKGLSETAIVVRHVLLNALLPVVTLVGLQAGTMLGGSVVVESVFALPGLGRLAYESVVQRDLNTLLGIVFVSALLVIFINFIVDLVYARLDPRISAETAGGRT